MLAERVRRKSAYKGDMEVLTIRLKEEDSQGPGITRWVRRSQV